MNLSEWRNEIDEIDGEILSLLERRANIVAKIGAVKAAQQISVVDEERERQILERIKLASGAALSLESANCIFRSIIEESRRIQIEIAQNKIEIC